MGCGDARANRFRGQFEIGRGTSFLDNGQALLAAGIDSQGHDAARSLANLVVGQAGFDVLSVDLPPTEDEHRLQAAGDEQFGLSQKAEVAGAQIRA